MCRSIRPLHNFAPPVTEEEIRAAALQYVRKIAGFTKPSKANETTFLQAVDAVTDASRALLAELTTTAPPRDREQWAARQREKRRVDSR